jgi:hypothetical protein
MELRLASLRLLRRLRSDGGRESGDGPEKLRGVASPLSPPIAASLIYRLCRNSAHCPQAPPLPAVVELPTIHPIVDNSSGGRLLRSLVDRGRPYGAVDLWAMLGDGLLLAWRIRGAFPACRLLATARLRQTEKRLDLRDALLPFFNVNGIQALSLD